MLEGPSNNRHSGFNDAKPYCRCWNRSLKVSLKTWDNPFPCKCGEELDDREWKWQKPEHVEASWMVLSDNGLLVTFHPLYSAGTAAAKGDMPLEHNHQYYWEVKMLTDTYGTDIMVGVGTDKFDIKESRHKFTSLLGNNAESYGLSYSGAVRHNSITITRDLNGFCKGSIIGVRLDMWLGTLEYYINRKSQGISFYNLRRHATLYPMVCSTAAQSSMKIIYAGSWKSSLLVDALKILSSSVTEDVLTKLPPGLCTKLKSHFWLTLPSKGCMSYDDVPSSQENEPHKSPNNLRLSSFLKRRHWLIELADPTPKVSRQPTEHH